MKVEQVVARGGHKTHLKPIGQFSALCGFAPSCPRPRLFLRSAKWYKGSGHSPCKKCHEKLREEARKITSMVQGTMGLEGQGLDPEALDRLTDRTIRDMLNPSA